MSDSVESARVTRKRRVNMTDSVKSTRVKKKCFKFYCCAMCVETFTQKSIRAFQEVHSFEGSFVCQRCHTPFSSGFETRRYTVSLPGEESFVCEICGKNYGSSQILEGHTKRLSEKWAGKTLPKVPVPHQALFIQ